MKKEPEISSLIDKAVFDYKLIEENDRILIGASGGKDSTLLLEYFANRKNRPQNHFEIMAVHIQTDFAPDFSDDLQKLFVQWNVPLEIIKVNVHNRLKKNQKMNCYWCSTQRRTELLNYALQNGFNKIALGHHLDDILETFIMNMTEKGNLSTMIPKMQYDKWPVSIIRPLCYVSEKRIITHAQQKGYSSCTCTCNFQNNSTRKEARKKLEMLTEGSESKKQLIFKALKNVQKEYLL